MKTSISIIKNNKKLLSIPETWKSLQIGSILKLEYGKALPARERDPNGQYPVFGSGGQIGLHSTPLTKAPVIVVGRKGSIGSIFYSSKPCWSIDTTYYIDDFPSYLNPKYVYFFLKTLDLFKLNRAAAIPGLGRDDVYNFAIPIPYPNNPILSFEIQHRIVSRIESLLGELKGDRQLLDEMRRDTSRVMEATLTELIKELDKQYPDSPTIDELLSRKHIKILGGGTPSTDNEEYWVGAIPWASPRDMKRWYIDATQKYISQAALQQRNLNIIPEGAVLIVVRGMILAHTFPVGVTKNEVTINQDMKALVPDESLLPEYLGYILRARAPSILQQVETAAHGTRRLKTDTLKKVTIPVISTSDQRRIIEYLNFFQFSVNEMEQVIKQDTQLIEQLEQSILEKAFQGQL